MRKFEVIVIGAGHAGCEAAFAAARLGAKVALLTLRLDRIAYMSCNPAIGGIGKGHLVHEIAALGGVMPLIADATGIQYRRLNLSRGPAVHSTRAQIDSTLYQQHMQAFLQQLPNLEIIEDEVIDLLTFNQTPGEFTPLAAMQGVVTRQHGPLYADAVIVTTGTFLNGLCHIGEEQFAAGRFGDAAASSLSQALRRVGLNLGRFKTGTTPRLAAESIQWNLLEAQVGDEPRPRFSLASITNDLPQISCFITYTDETTHQIVRDNLHRSPLYQGLIKGLGPRYCPSFEDKIVRFADKPRHQIFLERESLSTNRVYPNGLSTSLPKDVQEKFLHAIHGLEKAEILQYGYAVEYDYADPTQLTPALMTKKIQGLFLAGQINGTSGYEEAAAQGLMAGLNAVRFLGGLEPAILRREQAYIGVLIDDLVTRGVDEPYRIFTSRAEHRLTLREANAEERLWPLAKAWGLLSSAQLTAAHKREKMREELRSFLTATAVGPVVATALGLDADLYSNMRCQQLLRNQAISLSDLLKLQGVAADLYDLQTIRMLDEEIKYAGYIERERREIARLQELEKINLPARTLYWEAQGLSREIKEKLLAVKPLTLGQAARIPGVTPTSLAILRVHITKNLGSDKIVKALGS